MTNEDILNKAIRARDEAQRTVTRKEGEIASIEANIQSLLSRVKADYGVDNVPDLEALYEERLAEFNQKVEGLRKALDNAGSH